MPPSPNFLSRLLAGAALAFVPLLSAAGDAQTNAPDATPSALTAPAPVPAGIVPPTIALDITGTPVADPAFLEAEIRAALTRTIRPSLQPGASIAYGPIAPWPLLPLASGARAAVNVTVTISGGATSAPVSGVTLVVLNGAVLPLAEPSVLFLSDDPEYLLSEGLVFRGSVAAGKPGRLYYYHSDLGVPRDLDVVLSSTTATRIHVVRSGSGPDLDVMSVGHDVTRDFLRYWSGDEGIVLNVVPGAPVAVRHALLLPGEVAAGMVDVQVIDGGPVTMSVLSSAAGGRAETYLNGPRVPFDGHRRHGTFALDGFGSISGAYTVGGPAIAAQYGGRAPTPRNLDPADDGHDFGDYGVMHRITFTLQNPTDDAHRVYVYEKPLGGPVRSSFVVDGQLRELGCARVPQPYGVMTYELPPHSNGASTTLTMTDGGSFYPLELGVTDTQPLPETPPVGSPDGCSPGIPSTPT